MDDTPDAEIDAANAKLEDGAVVADLIVKDSRQTRHVVPVTWRPGHEDDWTWQGEETWLQTERYAEHMGMDPARLVALAARAVKDAVLGPLLRPA
ncbi:hypothetical protein EZJ19_13440 [Parasulfuritortus cantonensis]|uniref:Uncharacterized protein n=1 Tax=Parasulfuritortus cantonensis TaxID=2528202 RepID=A0A4R1B1Q4_9PROT|nr:hypothetical protein [Parasulfuritortus cantonensis]TCJ11962.1 hypothetical protein EZJ19_13440 [Parasulfuritortus cantonensis]